MNRPNPSSADLAWALARYDAEVEPRVIVSPRYRMRAVSWGQGPPVVLIHGMGDCARSFAMVMALLVDAGYRCLSYELANGLDDGAKLGMYKHPDFVDDLIQLLDAFSLKQVDLFGSSFGSTITLRALATYPDRFRRAVLQGGFPRRPLNRIERGLCRLGRFWPIRLNQVILRETVMERFEKGQFTGCPNEVFQFLISNSGDTPCRAAAHRSLIFDKLDLRPMLGRIDHPLLMIGGDIDALVPLKYEQEVLAGVRNSRRIEFSPCGHYPQYTHPGPTADAVLEFLK